MYACIIAVAHFDKCTPLQTCNLYTPVNSSFLPVHIVLLICSYRTSYLLFRDLQLAHCVVMLQTECQSCVSRAPVLQQLNS